MIMLIGSFFSWWYGRGWKQVIESFQPRLQSVLENFSVAQLSRTLFSPWRRIITYPGASLDEKVRAWADNMFSRAIGFVIRISVLLAAFVSLLIIAALTVVEIVMWPLLPPAVPILIIGGLL